ncbi:hypothetical protein O1611_g4378 [Lasiodiplodia mahajangana]|uniref:Uncharacterized protein n=1 Tax=Lasiodiplodia mahajangana TaxID=1108764 RepID=A0ACC2JPT0_9PEZI|nr:hypothetical protein O1611_g4378 [Lasiodiplodia mahajangana]
MAASWPISPSLSAVPQSLPDSVVCRRPGLPLPGAAATVFLVNSTPAVTASELNLDANGTVESHNDEPGQVDEVIDRPSVKPSQRKKRGHYPVLKRGSGLSRATFGQRGSSTMPMRTLRNATSLQLSQSSKPRTDSVAWLCTSGTSFLGTKARDGTDKNHEPSTSMAYQIVDLIHYHVPGGSSIVTATVRCSESNLPFNPIALYHKLLGGEGKVICMTQLSPDSWMLVGHQYNNGAPGAYNREGSMLHNTDRTSSPLSKATSDHLYHIDDNGDAEYKNREQSDTHSSRRTCAITRARYGRIGTNFKAPKLEPLEAKGAALEVSQTEIIVDVDLDITESNTTNRI